MAFFGICFGACMALSAILLFMIFPALRRHKGRERLNGLLIAHRGLYDERSAVPENSVEAFTLALVNGYAIETDIHITADGEIVIIHDSTLDRVCNTAGRVEELTLNELRLCRLEGTDQHIPTLKELLNLVDGRVPLIIEFKCDSLNCDRLCSVADSILSKYRGEYYIQSFNPAVLKWYKRHRNQICRGQLATVYKGKGLLKRWVSCFFCNFLTRPDYVAYDRIFADRPMFRLQKLLGAFPVGWTFTSQADLDNDKKKFKAYIFENFMPQN